MTEQQVPVSVSEWVIIKFLAREDFKHVENERRLRTNLIVNVRCAHQLLECGSRLTIIQIGSEDVKSYDNILDNIPGELGFKEVCDKWVPRLLTLELKLNCVCLLAKFVKKGDSFLCHSITINGTWVHQFSKNLHNAMNGVTYPYNSSSRQRSSRYSFHPIKIKFITQRLSCLWST